MRKWMAALLLAVQAIAPACAEPQAPEAGGIGIKDYPWQALPGERYEALERQGRRRHGKRLYALCRSCHLASGDGSDDGSVPLIAGQHSSVLIKQMADMRAGLRHNPEMFPFVTVPSDPQDLADLAAYIEGLCMPARNAGDAAPAAAPQMAGDVATGKELYAQACARCHGARGEGALHRVQPAVAGQHAGYLLRQMRAMRDGERPVADAEKARLLAAYSEAQLIALAAYQSALRRPGKACRPAARR